jgi:hypothetical protein
VTRQPRQTKPKGMVLPVGTRVLHRSGRLGTVEREARYHGKYGVRFDIKLYPRVEPDVCKITPFDLTPVDPKLHAKWEAGWPTFTDRSWAKPGEGVGHEAAEDNGRSTGRASP